MILKIKRLTPTAILPQYAHSTDSGMDLYYDGADRLLEPGIQQAFNTGISIELPPGTEAQIRGRSGLAFKSGIGITHGVGTIDEGYRGEIKVVLINHGTEAVWIKKHDRIAQMVIAPVIHPQVIEVTELSDSDRGTNGFGSTGVDRLLHHTSIEEALNLNASILGDL